MPPAVVPRLGSIFSTFDVLSSLYSILSYIVIVFESLYVAVTSQSLEAVSYVSLV